MKSYEVKLTGGGKKWDIIHSLEQVVAAMKQEVEDDLEGDPFYEDRVLVVEIIEQ